MTGTQPNSPAGHTYTLTRIRAVGDFFFTHTLYILHVMSLGLRRNELPFDKRPSTRPTSTATTPARVAMAPSTRKWILLRRWNAVMALLHATLAVVTLTVGNRALGPPLYGVDVDFVENLNRTAAQVASGMPLFELVPLFVAVGTLPLTWLVALFFALSAIGHFGNAFVWRAYYESRLEACLAPTRYLEYAFSAPVMIVLIAYTTGIRDYGFLLAIAFLIAVTMPFGYLTDLLASPQRDQDRWTGTLCTRLTPYLFGWVSFGAAYGIILSNFYDQGETADRAPWFVHFILWGQLVLFASFSVVPVVQQLRPPSKYYQGELVFQVLSLVSKMVLGILFLTQVLVLGSFEEAF